MNTSLTTKTCKMCCMEIPQQARKCPHCLHFQSRWFMVMLNPGFAVLFASLPIAAMLIVFSTIFDTGENFETYKGQIIVAESRIAFGDTKSGATVAVIGTIKNTSKVPWKDIYFHVDFYDATGNRADVGAHEDYEYSLPASDTSSFKVTFRREFSETNYAKAVVRVVGAKDARARF